MDDDLHDGEGRGEPAEGVRIIGAHEASPAGSRADTGRAPTRRVPTPSWDDDEGEWEESWGDEFDDADLADPIAADTEDAGTDSEIAASGRGPTRAPTPRSADDDGATGTWSSGPRWRSQSDDWDDVGEDDVTEWDDVRVGALAAGRSDESDLYAFDDPGAEDLDADDPDALGGLADDLEDDIDQENRAPAAAVRFVDEDVRDARELRDARRVARTDVAPSDDVDDDPRARRPRAASGDRVQGRAGRPPATGRRTPPPSARVAPPSSMGERVVTGVALLAGTGVLLSVFKARGGVALATVALAIAVFELFTALRQRGFAPAVLPGAAATVALPIVAYNRGAEGIVIVLVLLTLTTLLWYLFGVVRDRPAVNIAVTLFGVLFIGVLGGTAGLLLRAPHGVGLLLAVVLATVGYDIFGLFIGANIGQRALAPDISPNKTVEGLLGGIVGAFVVAVGVFGKVPGVTPWDTSTQMAVLLGLTVAIMAPLGDLTESMIKRDLGIKDMGSILPGHGGVLDRIDAMLFTVPGVYFLARWKGWA